MHVPCDSRARGLCTSYAVLVHVTSVILVCFSYTKDLPLDDFSLCLGIEMVVISRVEGRVLSLDCRERMVRLRIPNS